VQVQIEKRAHERWRAGECREGMALSDWFQAEGEVLKQFILAFARRHSVAQASSPKCKTQLVEARQRTNPNTKQSHNA